MIKGNESKEDKGTQLSKLSAEEELKAIIEKLVDGIKLSELSDEEKIVFKANSKSIRTKYNNRKKKQGGVKERIFNSATKKEKWALYKNYKKNR